MIAVPQEEDELARLRRELNSGVERLAGILEFHDKTSRVESARCELLQGFSGCRVVLCEDANNRFVRKIASLSSQNRRLKRQHAKQVRFWNEGIPTARVLTSGYHQGLYFFEMEYISGESIASQVCSGQLVEWAPLTDFLTRWFVRMRTTARGVVKGSAISEKIAQVIDASQENGRLLGLHPRIAAVGRELDRVAWPDLPASECHGDLTTENILADSAGSLYLIDFDQPSLSSYVLDIAKLYQDLLGHWALRDLAADPYRSSKLQLAQEQFDRLRAAMDDVIGAVAPEAADRLPELVCLSLIRALPYAQEEQTAGYIIDRVEQILGSCTHQNRICQTAPEVSAGRIR